jgi:uncharacterized repeat protein (TIGR03806 family)
MFRVQGGIAAAIFLCELLWPALRATVDDEQENRKAYGLEKRVLWTGSKVQGSPEPPPKYRTALAFPRLQKFEEPLDFAFAPGTQRLFVAERWGKIYSFLNDASAATADLVTYLHGTGDGGKKTKQHIYAFAVHPRFKENGFIFVAYIPDMEQSTAKGSRVSRFTAKGEPPVIDKASEKVIFEWPNGGHNGCCMKFGPDGHLYITTGDGSGIADENQIGQNLSSVHSKILRVDVDHPGLGKPYGIPKDNPFVDTKGALPEIWAYGLRQPWRMSFDRKTGELWCGEVGQDLWEMVYKIEKGGNYGWSVKEGTHDFRPERKKGPTPILAPVIEHSHSDFRSITGGFVYRGKRLPELFGHYIYGDFDTGRIWCYLGGSPGRQEELTRTTYRVVSWGEDEAAELYFLDFMGGGIYQLVDAPKEAAAANSSFPRKLSETGIFSSTRDHKVAPGVIAYDVNSQLWGDHAHKERFLAIPGEGRIGFDEVIYPQPPPFAPAGWAFPDGTVLVKTFSMDMERGNPKSRKRLETRILHFQKFPGNEDIGDQYWRGYTYVWNEEQSDAELVPAEGLDLALRIKAGADTVEQKYHLPSRAECTLCHTMAAKYALGASTMQMNRDHDYGGVVANQLATFEHIGLFTKKLPARPADLPRLADYNDAKLPTDVRARSYLHSNCSHCHTKWGGGNADFKLLASLPLGELGVINVPPAHGDFGIKGAKLVVPGRPEQSLILHRMELKGLGRMPHVGSREVDQRGADLVRDWIRGLKAKPSP